MSFVKNIIQTKMHTCEKSQNSHAYLHNMSIVSVYVHVFLYINVASSHMFA
jgi:hypothetical protein